MRTRILAGFLAASLLAFGNPDTTLNEKTKRYHQLLLKRPESATLFERFVNSWLDNGTKEDLETFLKSEAKSGTASEWRLLASYQDWMGREELALQAISSALEKEPNSSDLFFARAKLKARLLDFEGALEDLDKLPKGFDEEATTLKGTWLARSGKPEKALEAWQEILAAHPDDEELREDLIELQIGEGLYEEAIKTARQLAEVTKDPYQKALRTIKVARVQILAGEQEEGLKTYNLVLEKTGEDSWLEREVLAQVEKVFKREENITGLREFYSQLRQKFPQRVSLRKGLAFQMAANGETDEAIALFREILKITPADLENRQQFISLLENSQRFPLAIEELEFILKTQGDQPELWEHMARLRDLTADPDGLNKALKKVEELRISSAQGLISMAALYDRYHMTEQAEALLRKGTTDFPDAREVDEALASLLANLKGNDDKQKEATALWLAMAEGGDAEQLLRVSRALINNQRAEACFNLLSKRIAEFPENLLLLKQLCSAGLSAEKAEEALPFALKMASLAKTPTELDSALSEVARLSRRLDLQEVINELAAKENKEVTQWCVLAELYEVQGDLIASDQALTQATQLANGPMPLSQKVRLLVSRDEPAQAATVMREIIALPGGDRPVYLKKLVQLLSDSGQPEKALEATEQWKRLAPGDRNAWLERATLFGNSGEVEKAVGELRRAQAKFENDPELKSRLADALVEAGDYTEGSRIYRKLYEESEDFSSKNRWITKLASLAEQENRIEELLSEFERRKRRNSQEASPLLALATIYETLGDYNLQREALAEAVRRKPNVTNLRHQLSTVEERAGDIGRAIATLREAARLDKGPSSRQKLVALYFRHGEIESGLDLLRKNQSGNPREIETTTLTLLSSGEFDTALDYLQESAASDWRLSFLKGLGEYNLGNKENARKIFRTLSTVSTEIPGIKPLFDDVLLQQWKDWASAQAVVEPSREALLLTAMSNSTQQFLDLKSQQRSYGYRSSSSLKSQALPGTAEEMRALILSLLMYDANTSFGKERTELLAKIPYPPGPFGQQLKNRPRIAEWATEELEAGRLDLASVINFAISSDKLDVATLHRAVKELPETNPRAADLALKALINRKEGEPQELMAQRLKLLAFLKPEERTQKINQIAAEVLQQDRGYSSYAPQQILSFNNDKATKDTVRKFLLVELENRPKSEDKNSTLSELDWINSLLLDSWQTGQIETFIKLANRLIEEQRTQQDRPGLIYYNGTYYPSSAFGQGSRNSLVQAPGFPNIQSGTPPTLQRFFFSNSQNQTSNNTKTSDFEKRWKKARKIQTEKSKDENKERTDGIQPKELEPVIDQLNSPYLRILAYHWMGKKDELEKELASFDSSEDPEKLLSAAGYWHKAGNNEKSYQLLEKARLLPMEKSQRQLVDGHLSFIGAALAQSGTKLKKLETARRAILRLRRNSKRNPQESQQLTAFMTTLGLGDVATQMEIARLRKGALSNNRNSSRYNRGSSLNGGINQTNKDAAAREGLRQLRTLLRTQYSNWEVSELTGKLKANQLAERILKLADPNQSKSYSRRLEFAKICQAFDLGEKALPTLRALNKERPNDIEVSSLIIRLLPAKEMLAETRQRLETASLDEFGQMILRITNREEDDPFDTIDTLENAAHTELVLNGFSLAEEYLSKLEPSGESSRNLSWVIALLASDGLNTWETEDDITYAGFLKKQERKSDLDKRRFTITRKLVSACLPHPQLGRQIFSLIHAHRAGLEFNDEQLLEMALTAGTADTQWESDHANSRSEYLRTNNWTVLSGNSYRNQTPDHIGLFPDDFLATAFLTKKDTEAEELLTRLKEINPEAGKSIEKNRELASTSPQEFDQALKAHLDQFKALERVTKISQLLSFLIEFEVGEEQLRILENKFFIELNRQISTIAGNREPILTKPAWSYWKKGGAKEFQAYHERLLLAIMGPKDLWKPYLELSTSNRSSDPDFQTNAYFVNSYGQQIIYDCQNLNQVLAVTRSRPLLLGGQQGMSSVIEKIVLCHTVAEAQAFLKKDKFWNRSWADLGQTLDLQGDSLFMEEVLDEILGDNYRAQDQFGSKLAKSSGGRRFRNRLGAAYMGHNRNQIKSELEFVAVRLSKLPPTEFAGVKNLIGRLHPSFRIPGAQPKTQQLLEQLHQENKNDLLDLARKQIKEGFGGRLYNYSEKEKILEQTLTLISKEPKLAAEFFAAAINDPRPQQNHYTSFSTSWGGFSQPTRQDDLFSDLMREAEETDIRNWSRFQNHFESLPDGPLLSVGHAEYYTMRDMLSNFWEHQPKTNPKNLKGLEAKIFTEYHWDSLPKHFAKVDEQTREMSTWLLWLYAATSWSTNDLAQEHWDWIEESKYAERHPLFALRNQSLIGLRDWENISPKAQEGSQQAWQEILAKDNLSVRLRLEMACKAHSVDPRISDTPKAVELITSLLEQYIKQKRAIEAQPIIQLLSGLAQLETPLPKKEWELLLKDCSKAYLKIAADRSGNEDIREEFAKALIRIGLKLESTENVKTNFNLAQGFLRGQIDIMLDLEAAGQASLAKQLVTSPDRLYELDSDFKWTPELDQQIDTLLPLITNKQERFRIHCLLANAPAEKPEYEEARKAKLLAVAKRFAAEAPKAPQARLQCLKAFVKSRAAQAVLAKEMKQVNKTYNIVSAFEQDRMPGQLSADNLLTILTHHLWEMARRNHFEEIDPQIKNIAAAIRADDDDYTVNRRAAAALREVFYGFLTSQQEKDPQDVDPQILAYAKEWYQAFGTTSPDNRYLNERSVALPYCLHAIAGKAEEFDNWVKSLPQAEQEAYNRHMKAPATIAAAWGSNNWWQTKEQSKLRKFYTQAIIDDHFASQTFFKNYLSLRKIPRSGTLLTREYEDFFSTVDPEHPQATSFKLDVASGLTRYGRGKKNRDRGLHLLQETIKEAEEKKDTRSLNIARTELAFFLGEKRQQPKKALEIAETIDWSKVPKKLKTDTQKKLTQFENRVKAQDTKKKAPAK